MTAHVSWGRWLLSAGLTAAVTVALIIAAAALWPNDPPVEVQSLDTTPAHPVCPGTQLPINSRVTVEKPTILFLYVSVMDEGTNYNIRDTWESKGFRLHPHKSSFLQFVEWTVPSLPAGNYNRVFAVRGHNTDQLPKQLVLPFTVGDCP